jgi:hypothetical protein
MMYLLKKSKKSLEEGGLKLLISRAIRFSYREISVFFPYKYVELNEVQVPSHRLFGKLILGEYIEENKNYEQGIIRSIKNQIEPEDKVVICGGGYGVTAVKAAEKLKKSSQLRVYEASESKMGKIKTTLEKNDISDTEIKHGIVGPEVNIWGSSESANRIEPADLPSCDVLELDIEGSEIEVLRNLEISPRIIIVESHGFLGSKTTEVKKILQEKGYKILDEKLAEKTQHAKENDVKVITGKKRDE